MAKKEKRRRLPRLGRTGKILCNLALVLMGLFAVWAWAGYPLPTAQMRLQRAARQQMLSEVELGGRLTLDSGERLLVGYGPDYVLLYEDESATGTVHCVRERMEGGALIPVARQGGAWTESAARILAVDVPEGTARAVLAARVQADLKVNKQGWIIADGGNSAAIYFGQEAVHDPQVRGICIGLDEQYWAEGEPVGEGLFLFRLEKKHEVPQTENWTEWTWAEYYVFKALGELEPEELRQEWLDIQLECVFLDETGAELGRTVL